MRRENWNCSTKNRTSGYSDIQLFYWIGQNCQNWWFKMVKYVHGVVKIVREGVKIVPRDKVAELFELMHDY